LSRSVTVQILLHGDKHLAHYASEWQHSYLLHMERGRHWSSYKSHGAKQQSLFNRWKSNYPGNQLFL